MKYFELFEKWDNDYRDRGFDMNIREHRVLVAVDRVRKAVLRPHMGRKKYAEYIEIEDLYLDKGINALRAAQETE